MMYNDQYIMEPVKSPKSQATEKKASRKQKPKSQKSANKNLGKDKEGKKNKTKPKIFEGDDGQKKLDQLRNAYLIGCTHEQAALNADIGASTIDLYLKEKRIVMWKKNEYVFNDLVRMWRSNVGIHAKKKIFNNIKDPKTGTQDAWRYLERKESAEYGLSAGVGSVDSGANIDLSEVVKAKIEKYRNRKK